jgi:hypothetical protein
VGFAEVGLYLLIWVVGVLDRQDMIVRGVVAPALLDPPSAAELALMPLWMSSR